MRSQTVVETKFQWNYTTILNFLFIGLAAYLYWLTGLRGSGTAGQ